MKGTREGSTLVAVIAPARAARAFRACGGQGAAYRAEEAKSRRRARRVVILEVALAGARRLRTDPLLASAWIGRAAEPLAAAAGCGAVEIAALGAGPRRVFRVLGESQPPERPRGARHARAMVPAPLAAARLPRPSRLEGALRIARASAREGTGAPDPAAGALWLPAALLPKFLSLLARGPEGAWRTVRLGFARDGAVASGAIPARAALREAGLSLAVPLETLTLGGGQALYAERGLALPAFIGELEPPSCPILLRVERGAARAERLEPAREALALLATGSRRLQFDRPPPSGMEAAGDEDDPRSPAAIIAVVRGLEPSRGGDAELREALEQAFGKPRAQIESGRGHGPQSPAAPGWMRHFLPRRVSAALRRLLDRSARQRLADPRARREIIARQRDALSLLLRKLSGPGWRDALPAAPPLRARGDTESRWLDIQAGFAPVPVEFSLELLREQAASGVAGAGELVYGQLQALYRRSAGRLLAAGEHRRAAHVWSYLLGEHERAAEALEAAASPLEAATVYYHLARQPTRAAACLDRAGLHEEAARIWMDLGRWREAARSWRRTRNEAQAAAAWRMVAVKLRSKGDFIAAAEVLDRELGETRAALVLLERSLLELGPRSLDALERALRKWVEIGEPEMARRTLRWGAAVLASAAGARPFRPAFKRLVEWAGRAALLGRDLPAVAGAAAIRAAWLAAARAWAGARADSPRVRRTGIDRLLIAAGRNVSEALSDPWLASDLESWLRAAERESRPPPAGAPVRESALPARCSCLASGGGYAMAGTEDGRIFLLDGEGRVEREIDTRSTRSIAALAAAGPDLYCAAGARVFHFSLAAGGAGRPQDALPLQVERSLAGNVTGLLFQNAGPVLRVAAGQARWLDPVHLGPLSVLHDPGPGKIRSACANRRFVALLVARPGEEGSGALAFEALVIPQSWERGPRPSVRETFPVLVEKPRRLAFLGPQTDDLIVIGKEEGTVVPSRRTAGVSYHLEAAGGAGRMPHARVQPLPGRDAVLIAYGDGSLERLSPASGARSFIAEAPGGGLDPLAGLELAGRSHEAWLLHRSGKLRRVPLMAAPAAR